MYNLFKHKEANVVRHINVFYKYKFKKAPKY